LKKLKQQIEVCRKYVEKVQKTILLDQAYASFKIEMRPKWPKKARLPEKLQRHRQALWDAFQQSPFDD